MILIRMSTHSHDYASAAWDEDDVPDITLDTVPGKFKTTITNILSKHCSEIKSASDEIIQPITVSKKKLKELVSKHNNELFSFMARPDKTPHIIGIAETIFKRFGYDIPSIKGNNTNTVLRDLNLDASMNIVVSELDDHLIKLYREGDTTVTSFMKQTHWIFNQYKNIGEEILRQETVLHQRLDLLDKLNNRIPVITSLVTNEVLPELIDTFSKYVDSVYKTCKIEECYINLVELYKKWNIYRQIVSIQHNLKNNTNESQCSICLTEAVSYAIVPCGHTFCSLCSKKQNTNCYICRGIIRERVKLYFA
jgi:hypothetical protein